MNAAEKDDVVLNALQKHYPAGRSVRQLAVDIRGVLTNAGIERATRLLVDSGQAHVARAPHEGVNGHMVIGFLYFFGPGEDDAAWCKTPTAHKVVSRRRLGPLQVAKL